MTDYGHELEFGYFLILAKAAATLDLLSGGRFVAGLGGGGFLDAAHAMGAPTLTPGDSREALEEAIVILRASWSTAGVLRFHGRHYHLDGARPGPSRATRSASGWVQRRARYSSKLPAGRAATPPRSGAFTTRRARSRRPRPSRRATPTSRSSIEPPR
jgi:alkanesulfonate monooxygenase SsuD/methylene tetrahydromethanopterin reductase-like flavin-dependent oxidoreductase (luciferase family)